jgi:hypothetical protein
LRMVQDSWKICLCWHKALRRRLQISSTALTVDIICQAFRAAAWTQHKIPPPKVTILPLHYTTP